MCFAVNVCTEVWSSLDRLIACRETTSSVTYCYVLFGIIAWHGHYVTQVTVDVFLIDWERPRGKAAQATDMKVDTAAQSPVSIWRTCFVANEWNEIQTVRKINSVIQIFSVVFFLHVVGFGNVASRDARSDLTLAEDEYHAASSRILRFAISSAVFLGVGESPGSVIRCR